MTTEFAHQQTGKTRNPHNLEHTPGGSSSGSAAAVAAGMVPVATGTQTAGSVIRPAAYCGVAALQAVLQADPDDRMKCYAWSLDTAGLYGAGVADVAFATAAMTGRDLRVDRASPAAPRVALIRTHIWADASADMQNAIETTARALEAAGASVKESHFRRCSKMRGARTRSPFSMKPPAPMRSNMTTGATCSDRRRAMLDEAARSASTPMTMRAASRSARAWRSPT